MSTIVLQNAYPTDGYTGASGTTLIYGDILSNATGIQPSTIDAYVNGVLAFHGPNTFIAPYNGSQSSIVQISDSYDGYRLTIDNTETFSACTDISVNFQAEDTDANSLDETFSFRTGTNLISFDINLYEITLDVTFGGPMNSIGLTNPANYTFSNGMYARYIESIDSSTIRMWVELFYGEETFTITTSSDILDSYGDPIPSSYNGVALGPFPSEASFSNFNGKIRTSKNNSLISADANFIYMATDRGIDVLRRNNLSNASRWAQVFDEYGINSMYIANFGDDLEISDTAPPVFLSRTPVPGANVSSTTSVSVAIYDEHSAIEPTSLIIYIDNEIAFNGVQNGFANGYYGTVQLGYRTIYATISPPSAFLSGSTVWVRAIATDLLGNRLDSTYQFTIESGTLGFGLGSLGISSFGGI